MGICKEVIRCDSFIKQYASWDKKLDEKLKKTITETEHRFLLDSTDDKTGGIYINDYEWLMLNDDNPWKKAFGEKKDFGYKYILNDIDKVILRGAWNYYYLLSYKGRFDPVTIDFISSWIEHYLCFFNGFTWSSISVNTNSEKKCFLGLLDNLRNYYLVLLNMYIIVNYTGGDDSTICVMMKDDEVISIIFNALKSVYLSMRELSCDKCRKYFFDLSSWHTKLIDITAIIKKVVFVKSLPVSVANKCLKSHRECDSFFEMLLTCELFFSKRRAIRDFVGVLFGGIEIPLVAKSLYEDRVSDIGFISLEGFFQDRHNMNGSFQRFVGQKILNKQNITLCDDNVLTGNTIDSVIRYLGLSDNDDYDILIIRRTPCNRIYHLLQYKSVINLDLYQVKIEGLLFKTHYSKIRKGTNNCGMYLDDLYRFDCSKEHLYELIFLNGVFDKKSRVNKYYKIREIEYEQLSSVIQ